MHLTVVASYPIQPQHIQVPRFFEAFSSTPMNFAAVMVLKVQQRNGKWVPFTAHHVEHACDLEGKLWSVISPGFDELVASGLLILMGNQSGTQDPTYVVSHEFIAACFADSPSDQVATIFPSP